MIYNKSDILDIVKDKVYSCNKDQKWIYDNLVYLEISGSRKYGTHNENSDYDIKGLTFATNLSYWVGASNFEQFEFQDKQLNIDCAIYNTPKFAKLIARSSPNVIEMLFENEDCTIFKTNIWNHICPKITKLISNECSKSYSAYSYSQIKKGKSNCGDARRELIEKFGYDTKFISHAFRLLRQAVELTTTGKLTMPRPDAQELISVRNGSKFKTYEEAVKSWESEYQILKNSDKTILQNSFNFKLLDSFLIEFFQTYVTDGSS